jgi:hypothetical protein
MPTQDQFFPSRFLRADDIKRPVEATIREVVKEEMNDGKAKPVVYFRSHEKGWVIGPENFRRIAFITGCPDSDDWPGSRILLKTEPTTFKGKPTRGIRAHAPISKKSAEPEVPNDGAPDNWGDGDLAG